MAAYLYIMAPKRPIRECNGAKGRKVAHHCVETYLRYLIHFRNLVHLPHLAKHK